jgi:hypothetical protein
MSKLLQSCPFKLKHSRFRLPGRVLHVCRLIRIFGRLSIPFAVRAPTSTYFFRRYPKATGSSRITSTPYDLPHLPRQLGVHMECLPKDCVAAAVDPSQKQMPHGLHPDRAVLCPRFGLSNCVCRWLGVGHPSVLCLDSGSLPKRRPQQLVNWREKSMIFLLS